MSLNCIKQNRSLLMNIQKIKQLRQKQRDHNSSSVNTLEIYRMNKHSESELDNLRKEALHLEIQISKINGKMEKIENKLDSITALLAEIKKDK